MELTPEILTIIEKIANRIAPKFTFGYYDLDDIKQEIFILALDGIKQYDSSRGKLGSFLFQFVNSRIKNLKRDVYFRQEFKCSVCNNANPDCDNCIKRGWKMTRKKQLLDTENIDGDRQDKGMIEHFDYLENLANKEIIEYIDRNIPVALRDDYLKMKENLYVHKQKRSKVEEYIKCLIKKLNE